MVEPTKMLEAKPGETSVMRVAVAATVAVVIGLMVISNVSEIVNCLIHGRSVSLVDIPTGMLGVFTAIITGKAIQSFAEKE